MLVALSLVFPAIAQTRIQQDKTGQYFCYQQGDAVRFGHTIGFGPFRLNEDERKFVINLSPVEHPLWVRKWCTDEMDKVLHTLSVNGGYNDDDYRNGIPWLCLTKDQLKIGNIEYRAYRMQFEFLTTGGDIFRLYADNSYEREDEYVNPVSRVFSHGHCEKIVPAKQ